MNQTRTFLLLALLFVAYLLFNQWMNDYHRPPPTPATTSSAAAATSVAGAVPAPVSAGGTAAATTGQPGAAPTDTNAAHGPLVTVTTDVLRLVIDSRGGSLVRADLLKYPKTLESSDSVRLFNDSASHFYVAQSGLIGIDGSTAPNHNALFQAVQSSYTLSPGQDELVVELTWSDAAGVTVTKRYILHRGSYVIDMTQTVVNAGSAAWSGQAYRQLQRVVPPESDYSNFLEKYSDQSRYSFFGGAWYGPEEKFNKLKFDEFVEHPLAATEGTRGRQVTGGWIAMEQPYFLGAWLPPKGETDHFSTDVLDLGGNPRYLVRAIGPVLHAAPGQQVASSARLYAGPKLPSVLSDVAPQFDLAVNYGMMTIIARPLHSVLSFLHGLTGNWGWAIVLLVLLINIVIYKLNATQYRSSARMRQLKPRMDALKERYGDDKQKLQQATMELYKKEKVNPVAGCLPVLVTIPIFFGLYELLRESVELRQAPFIGWIHDLSAADPYFVLPILYAVVMLVQSLTMPMTPGMDATQQKMMKFMPVLSAVFFAFFPAGLALYYLVNGLCRLATQWWVYRKVDQEQARKGAKA